MADERRIDPEVVRWSEPLVPGRPLLVMLHGRGADERDLEGLVPFLPRQLVVASLRAPIAEGPGYSWYPMNPNPDEPAVDADVDAVVRGVLTWMDELPSVPATGLLGFSQGGAMSVQLLRCRPQAFAFAVVLSGFVIGDEHEGDSELAGLRPPTFWGRGTFDAVISAGRIEQATRWLPAHTRLTAKTYETGHSITQAELADVSIFIESSL